MTTTTIQIGQDRNYPLIPCLHCVIAPIIEATIVSFNNKYPELDGVEIATHVLYRLVEVMCDILQAGIEVEGAATIKKLMDGIHSHIDNDFAEILAGTFKLDTTLQ